MWGHLPLMAGIRIGGTAILEAPEPEIPVLSFDGGSNERSIWKIGNGAAQVRLEETVVSSLGTPQVHLGDPERNPADGLTCVYCRFTSTGTITRSVRLVDWADTVDVELYSDGTGGTSESLQPQWAPDGSYIIFRAKGAGSALDTIKRMDPDGSNVTTLYTSAGPQVFNPTLSADGTRMSWIEATAVMVSDADGTGATAEYTPGGGDTLGESMAWQKAANVIAFYTTIGTDQIWKVMNDDGTGLSTWETISTTGYGPGQSNPTPIMYTWNLNDEIVTTVRDPPDGDPDAKLCTIDSGGLTYISPAFYAATDSGSLDLRPVAIVGFDSGTERYYLLYNSSPSEVYSTDPTGADFRLDFDGAGTSSFHGFRGDTLNV